MPAFRFCRTDDIARLVEAFNVCAEPPLAGPAPLTAPRFKALIRTLDVWCSSCMIVVEDGAPVGVMLGAKRDDATAIHALAVHPAHRRRGHARHMLRSLEQKLAILGPPRLVAEVPEELPGALEFFDACGWRREGRLATLAAAAAPDAAPPRLEELVSETTVQELEASGLLGDAPGTGWHRATRTLANLGPELRGRAIAGAERVEAFVLARGSEDGGSREVLRLGHAGDESGLRALQVLLDHERRDGPVVVPRVSDAELAGAPLASWGFEGAGAHVCYATEARPRHE